MDADSKHVILDKIGMATSFLCAIHCMALPLLLTVGLIGGMTWLEHDLVEWSLIVFAVTVAVASFGRSYHDHHELLLPTILAISGCILLLISLTVSGIIEHLIAALGGLMLATGHYIKWSKLKIS